MNIRDIASAAHVSVATVSKVINHKDSEISNETRQRVLSVIKEYQYTPYANIQASFQTFHKQTIAFITEKNSAVSKYVFDIEKNVSKAGYSLVVCTVDAPASDSIRKHMKLLDARKTGGILLGLSDSKLIEETASLNYSHIPLISLSSSVSNVCSTFLLDYKAVSVKAVEELIHLGHKNIGCIVDPDDSNCADACIAGYQNALSSLSPYSSKHHILTQTRTHKEIEQGIQAMLQEKVTAIFCQTVQLAYITYEILKEKGYYIPNNISVICGETSPFANYLMPVLTSCSFSHQNIISDATEALIRIIEKHNITKTSTIRVHPVIHDGESIAPPSSAGKQILVIGNCNTDINIRVSQLPKEGELLFASGLSMIPGGKAVTQAISAGKLGGTVYILGCVGNDSEASVIINSLKDAYVHTEGLSVLSSAATGKAFIMIPENGNSSIVTYPGTNAQYSISHIRPYRHLFQTSDYCLVSTELSEELIDYIIKECYRNNVKTFVKPIFRLSEELLPRISFIIPNSRELDNLVPGDESYEEKAEYLYHKGCSNVIVTLGNKGSYLRNKDYSIHIPAIKFNTVDSNGAANCFISSLAVALSQSHPLLYSICFATYAAGISTTQQGVMTSLPDKQQLDGYTDDIQDFYNSLNC